MNNMTIDQAISLAEHTDNGELNPFWREVVETLAAEIRVNRIKNGLPVSDDPCRCPACRIAKEGNEVKGPLPALILAGELDHLADEMIDKAKEIEIYSISHSHHADELRGAAKQVLQWANEIRGEK